jgi:hypothetical protein
MLRLCPFGNVLLAYQKESIRLDFSLYIFIGRQSREQAYKNKSMGVLCTFLPFGDDYSRYDWPINGQKIIIFDTGGVEINDIKRICHHFVTAFKPAVLFTYSEMLPNQIYYSEKKGSSND